MPDNNVIPMFAPLTAEERASTGIPRKAASDHKTPIIPVPDDAPAPETFQHHEHGSPSKVWCYYDADNRLVGCAARFDFVAADGSTDKVVLPLTYCDLGNGKRGWRSKGVPDPRPLYRLPELNTRIDATVLVTEGEKAAEAAATLFPDHVATTPMHGAKSPHKTDWSPVTGRRVVIWPDNDGPGKDFANRVAELASKAGAASVSIVSTVDSWPKGWDLADALPPGVTSDELTKMLVNSVGWVPPPVASPPSKLNKAPAKSSFSDDDKEMSQRDQLIMVGMEAELWQDHDHVAYVTVMVDQHYENYTLRSPAFKRWLLGRYGDTFPRVIGPGAVIPGSPSSQALNDALNALEAIANKGGLKEPFIRIGEYEGQVVLDLGTPDWSAVVVGPDGWHVVAHPPVPFVRPNGFRALPVPVLGGDIHELRPFVNVADEADFMLAVSFLVAALKRKGPFPIAIVNGEQGSAKSTFCRVLRRLVDPNAADLRSPPKEERDALIAAINGWLPVYDNLSYLDGDQADWFCRIATGGGFATRALYTNNEESLISVCRPVVLNGIPALASRPDLADRAIALTLPVIPEGARQSELAFWNAFEEALPRILGALLDGVSMALRNLPTVTLPKLPRMADFALWSVAAFPAYGWTVDDFLNAYEGNRLRGIEDALEADPMTAAITEIVNEHVEYTGTAAALLSEINGRVPPEIMREKGWPKDATRLSNRLRRLSPAIRRIGIEIELGLHIGRGAEKKRGIRLRRLSMGTLNGDAGDTGSFGGAPKNYEEIQGANPVWGRGDAGDAEKPLLSASSPWQVTI